ncbi:acetyl-CoA C-acetyltransferase, partial [Klebsiella pneumoniae]|nr:acetyl-CoA C-acetyltransferase [Klebsiella pneumoniae]
TAGNASYLNYFAASVLLILLYKPLHLFLPSLSLIFISSISSLHPTSMVILPFIAFPHTPHLPFFTLYEVDLIEANEAFAVQALAVGQLLEWDSEKVNVNGGAIALGHPIGASGCRILVSLVHEMQRRGASKGLATLCVGGGQGIAMTLQR